jgi:glyoxylase-like metal-dependent hydrolase (beta-lactamase superfamily II)
LPDDTKHFLTRTADKLEHIDTDLAHTVHAPPTVGFEKELTINLGNREAKVMWLGRANTGGDAVAWVPDSRILLTGDAVVFPTPFAFGSYMLEWPVTLQKMIEMNARTIIPGRGPVMHEANYLKTLAEMFQALSNEVKEAVAEGLSLADTRKKVALNESSKRMAGGSAWRLPQRFSEASRGPRISGSYRQNEG